MACRRSSCLIGISKIIRSSEANLVIDCLPKSITTSINYPISLCLYNSLLILKGNNSRISSRSKEDLDREVEIEFEELENDPFPEKNWSDGLRILGDWKEGAKYLDKAIPLCPWRVRRKDEVTIEMNLEFWGWPKGEIGFGFAKFGLSLF